MRPALTFLSLALIVLAVFLALHSNRRRVTISQPIASPATAKHDFEKEIKPILQTRCQPCHFQGGKVYDRMPFDKPATIFRLGTKLFTRIRDEKERQLIREFLAEN